ncbi:sulfatase-like hydrolase/transferase [Ferrimonas pelagia]|uniref:Sulfatase n=1 Tax=Ferrimonas pelagia TaxID=1177826 RepID=A0ABP9FC39_9GAMM
MSLPRRSPPMLSAHPLPCAAAIALVLAGCGGSEGTADDGTTPLPPQNQPPLADAGADQAVSAGALVQLSAAASSDPDGDPLSYRWQLLSQPQSSEAQLSENDGVSVSFHADQSGEYLVELVVNDGTVDSAPVVVVITAAAGQSRLTYAIVGTDQRQCFDPASGEVAACAGQGHDADYLGNGPSYTLSADGLTVTDEVTGLVWQQSTDRNGDGVVNTGDKLSQAEALAYCDGLTLGGRDDWRLPDLKTLYSLILFSGEDGSGYLGTDPSVLKPFLAPELDWTFGDLDAGERLIDGQYASSTVYTGTTMNNSPTMFGVNFVDGRIKGYNLNNGTYYVRCVAGNPDYGRNALIDRGDSTVVDEATALMWQQQDSQSTDWPDAIAQCEAATTGGFEDWRLPDVKELHSLLDYSRSPQSHATAAIDPVFASTAISNEAGLTDWGYYWSSTTHKDVNGRGRSAAYVSFGEALGFHNGALKDVHGAGAQRSNDKLDVATTSGVSQGTGPNGVYYYKGPQGDILRHDNLLRCVRHAETLVVPTDGSANLLLIIADDVGIDNISGYGAQPNHSAQTPSIDALADDGVRFDHAWANPMCSPTRASLLTGRFAFRHGVTHTSDLLLEPSEQLLPELLQRQGYHTALFGKWHLGNRSGYYPTDRGFDYAAWTPGNIEDYFDWSWREAQAGEAPVTVSGSEYATLTQARQAAEWIKAQPADQPWFVQLAFNAPHSPFQVPPQGSYQGVDLIDPAGTLCNGGNDKVSDCYRAMVSAMDGYIGELLAGMDADTLANTLIVFVGDNGTPGSAIVEEAGYPFRKEHGKGTVYEGGVQVPLIISGGAKMGIRPAQVDAPVLVQDLFSTLLAVGSGETPANPIDGQSLLGYLSAGHLLPTSRESLYSELYSASEGIDRWAVSSGELKYLENEGSPACFDLAADPAEQTDLYLQGDGQGVECDALRALRPLP